MPSASYRELTKSIGELRRHLLPRRFDPAGDYRERVFTGVISFRVLSHAAIEEYLESRAIEIAVKAARLCKDHGVISTPAAHLCSFTEIDFGPPPQTIDPPQPSQKKTWMERIDLSARVARASGTYISQIKSSNHGIREENILRILLPIGYKATDIDPLLISELDNYGKARGEYAHSSSSKHVKKKPNPKDELDKVLRIVDLLKVVDQQLDGIYRSIR